MFERFTEGRASGDIGPGGGGPFAERIPGHGTPLLA